MILALILIIFDIFLRVIPHPANFAPITASALFVGTYLPKKWAFLVPILAMIISDYLLYPNMMFHSTTAYVWGSFMISGLIGLWLKSHQSPKFIFGASLISSLQFFLVTNFGVWLTSGMYEHTFSGLMQSYVMGVPFYRWTLLGDLIYTGAFFGIYQLAPLLSHRIKQLFQPTV